MSAFTLDNLQESLDKEFEKLGFDSKLNYKNMFGGRGAFFEGVMFASLSNVGLALKLSQEDQILFLKLPNTKRLQYSSKAPVSKTYVVVPDSMIGNSDLLGTWIKRSLLFLKTQNSTH